MYKCSKGGFSLRDGKVFSGSLVYVLLIIFTAGVVLGAVSVFHIPDEISQEAGALFTGTFGEARSTPDIIKGDFTVEIIWMLIIWVLGTLSILAPFIAATVAVRGFMIGFSASFIISVTQGDTLRLLLAYVLPQCLFSLPVMTIFSILCTKACMERKSGETTDTKYFVMGAVFVPIIIIMSLFEGLISVFFINMH